MHVNLTEPLSHQSECGSEPRNGVLEQQNGAGQQGSTYSICDDYYSICNDYYGCFDLRSHVMHDKDIVIIIFIHHHFLFSPSPPKTLCTEALIVSMNSFSLQDSFHCNTSSIDDDTYMALNLSHGLDNMLSSVSLSPNTSARNTFLSSAGDFLHSSRAFSSTLGGSFYESGAYTSNTQDKYQRLEWELSKEKKEHMKLRKVIHFRILQHNS